MRTILDKEGGTKARTRGFTLAETLIVVAILGVLGGLVAIGIIRWQNVLRQLEYDATAKELYLAAQNHLALAESRGQLDETSGKGAYRYDRGTPDPDNPDLYYLAYSPAGASDLGLAGKSVLSLMLPFGSIDDTVRVGVGTYVIAYEPDTATVRDVFYTKDDAAKGIHLGTGDAATLMGLTGADHKSDRRRVTLESGGTAIVGWFGGEGGVRTLRLKAPVIKVDNGDVLKVTVIDPKGASGMGDGRSTNEQLLKRYATEHAAEGKTLSFNLNLRVVITGKDSRAQAWMDITGLDATGASKTPTDVQYVFTLDDITEAARGHQDGVGGKVPTGSFAEMMKHLGDPNTTGVFVPGEDLELVAWVSCDWGAAASGPAGAAASAPVTTNSLFAQAKSTETAKQVTVTSFRHLANLDWEVSGFEPKSAVEATQLADLSWQSFCKNLKAERRREGAEDPGDPSIYYYGASPDARAHTDAGVFFPVYPRYDLTYDGGHAGPDSAPEAYAITGVKLSGTGAQGVFAALGEDGGPSATIRNLEIVNASVSSTGAPDAGDAAAVLNQPSAGALAGYAGSEATIENVLVRTTRTSSAFDKGKVVTCEAGDAGGLVGTADGATITNCAAAVYVSGKANAGGLVGKASKAAIVGSYAGGHTTGGSYSQTQADVTAALGNAGGLVGSFEGGSITSCYSTCSASGANAGGLMGAADGGAVSDSYVTGLVKGSTTAGAFVGSADGTDFGLKDSNHYYQIINMVTVGEGEAATSDYMAAIGSAPEDVTTVTPFDDPEQKIYDSVAQGTADAVPYDMDYLKDQYNGKYPFKAIAGFGSSAYEPVTDPRLLPKHLRRHYGDWPKAEVMFVNANASTGE